MYKKKRNKIRGMAPWYTLKLCCVLIILVSGVSCKPDTEIQTEFNFISSIEQIKLGKEASKYIQKTYGIYKDEVLSQYVNSLIKKLSDFSENQEISYHCTVLDSPRIRAFSLVGGNIFITRGYLSQINSEAELVFVLAREVAHLDKKHGEQRISRLNLESSILTAQLIIGKTQLNEWKKMTKQIAKAALKGYSKKNEYVADKVAIQYMTDLDYDPNEAVINLMTVKRQLKKVREEPIKETKSTREAIPELMTEEIIKKRETTIQKQIDNLEKEEARLMNREIYLDQIQELVIGDAKQSGRILKNWYINDHLRFEFDPILDWKYVIKLEKPIISLDYRGVVLADIRTVVEPLVDVLNRVVEKVMREKKNIEEAETTSGQKYVRYEYNEEGSTIIGYFFKRNIFKKVDKNTINIEFKITDYYGYVKPRIETLIKSIRWVPKEKIKNVYHLIIHTVVKGETLQAIAKQYKKELEDKESEGNESEGKESEDYVKKIAEFNNMTLNQDLTTIKKLKIPIPNR